MAVLVLLLNDEPCSNNGCEVKPALAEAVPVLGNCRLPREMIPPLTSKVAAGVVVLMPMSPELDWNNSELPRIELEVQRGIKSGVPEPTTAAVVPTLVPLFCVPLAGLPGPSGASMNAEGGNPPMVCASLA